MKRIKIDWKCDDEPKLKEPLDSGYYLVKDKYNNVKLISLSGGMMHFHENNDPFGIPTHNEVPYANFSDHYELIGKVNSFRITDIELE